MFVQSEAGPLKEDAGGDADAYHDESQEEGDPDVIISNAHEVSRDIDGDAEENHYENYCLILKSSRIPVLSEYLENIPLKHQVDSYQMKHD